jgi:hypothetical protein
MFFRRVSKSRKGRFGVRWHDTALPLHDMSCAVAWCGLVVSRSKNDWEAKEKSRDMSRNSKAAS